MNAGARPLPYLALNRLSRFPPLLHFGVAPLFDMELAAETTSFFVFHEIHSGRPRTPINPRPTE